MGREIRLSLRYDWWMPKNARGRPPYRDILTPTEWRITHAVQHGLTNKDIAGRRGTSADAVKFHVSNIMAKLGVRNRRELQKLLRAPADSALGKQVRRERPPPALGKLGQLARSVRNAAESAAWYRDVLGVPHLYTFGTLAFFDLAGTRLMLSQSEGEVAPESILYFTTDDILAAHGSLCERGVQFLNAPHMVHRHVDGTEEWMCFFKDLEERPLALISQVRPA